MSKRMFVLQNICMVRDIELEYLFGLFNLYSRKHSGKWFWQKAVFSGGLKEAYEGFNRTVDDIVKAIKKTDWQGFSDHIKGAADNFDRLLDGLELSCEVDRETDYEYVKSCLDQNLKSLINDSLKPLRK